MPAAGPLQASVYDVVCAMRSERPCMVQTFPQYSLVYDCVLEEMHAGDTWVSEDLRERYTELNRHNPNTGHTYLRDQFILLETMVSSGCVALSLLVVVVMWVLLWWCWCGVVVVVSVLMLVLWCRCCCGGVGVVVMVAVLWWWWCYCGVDGGVVVVVVVSVLLRCWWC